MPERHTDPRNPQRALSPAKLVALLDTGNQVLLSLLHNDPQETLSTVAHSIRATLDAEACFVFLPSSGTASDLELAIASYDGAVPGETSAVLPSPLRELVAGLHEWNTPVNLGYAQLAATAEGASPQAHLASGTLFSSLGFPLINRKGRFAGWVRVDNKKSAGGSAGGDTSFDSADEDLAQLLAYQLVILVEKLRCFQALSGILEDLQDARNVDAILHSILRRAVDVLGANRGDIAIWNQEARDILVAAVYGAAGPATLPRRAPVPSPSLMRSLWEDHSRTYTLSNVPRPGVTYYESHPRTRCELAVRFELNGRPIGILNAESFDDDAFDDQDVSTLMLLARHAAVAVQVSEEETALWHTVQVVLKDRAPPRHTLQTILWSVREIYGFDTGLIYIADYLKEELRCEATMGCEGVAGADEPFKYKFDDTAAATRILAEKQGHFSADPLNDPWVNPRGLLKFDMRGPLVGVPLIYGDKVVGVLVASSRHGPPPRKEHIDRLKPLATLAAWKIAASELEAERADAERRLKESEGLYHSLVEMIPHAVFRKDLLGRFTFANQAFCDLLGLPLEKVRERTDFDFYPAELAAAYQRDDQTVLDGRVPVEKEERHVAPAQGSESHVRVHKVPIVSPGGDVTGLQGIFWDITDTIRAAKQRERLLKDKEILLEDTHHRVWHAFAYTVNLLKMQARRATPEVEAALKYAERRIYPLAHVHQVLYRTGQWINVNMPAFVSECVNYAFGWYKDQLPSIAKDVHVACIELNRNTALYCGLIISELISNSLSHAFLGTGRGTVRVSFGVDPGGYFVLEIADDGTGMSPEPDLSTIESLGLKLVYWLATQHLKGTVSLSTSPGTAVTIRFPPPPPGPGDTAVGTAAQ